MPPGEGALHRFQRWRDAIQVAPDAKTINGVMRDFIATELPDVSALPVECQRALSSDPLDVQATAVTLLRCEVVFDGPAENRAFLHELAYTFAAASVRFTILTATSLAH
jgi:hypothetical protein